MKKRSLIIYFIIISSVIISLGVFDAQNLDNFLYQSLHFGPLKYYDFPLWNFLTVVGTMSAVAVALYASNKSSKYVEKQLEIEQKPYVIIKEGVLLPKIGSPSDPREYLLNLKNIGRGPAFRVTVSTSKRDKDKPLFKDVEEPHSCDLGSNDEKTGWKIDSHNLELLIYEKYNLNMGEINSSHPLDLYIFFKDQLKKEYTVETKLQMAGSGNFLKVMENKLLKE